MFGQSNMFDFFGQMPPSGTKSSKRLAFPLQRAATSSEGLISLRDSKGPTVLITVQQFKPAWAIQAYMRFAKIPYRVANFSFPSKEPTGQLPALADGHYLIDGSSMLSYLQREHVDLDQNLPSENKAEAKAFLSMIGDLESALDFILLNSEEKDPCPSAYNVMPFPFNKMQFAIDRVYRNVQQVAKSKSTLLHTHEQAIGVLKTGYKALQEKMCDGDFFFGKQPCSLDAVLFGHLAGAVTHEAIFRLVPDFPKVSMFFQKISKDFFSSSFYSCELLSPLLCSIYQRCDYMNAQNCFNQMKQSTLVLGSSSYVPDFFSASLANNREQPNGNTPEGSDHPAVAAPIESSTDQKQKLENRRWLSVVSGIFLGYLVLRSNVLSFEQDHSDSDDEEQ